MVKRGNNCKDKFCYLSKEARCEQRWSKEYVSAKNITGGYLATHSEVCKVLNIKPLVTAIEESCSQC